MSWKVYSLGNAGNAQAVANLVTPKLTELGYAPTYSNSGTNQGTLNVNIDGTAFSAALYTENTTANPIYLWVNDETKEVVVCKYVSATNPTNTMSVSYTICFAVLHGTSAQTGEPGLFSLDNTKFNASYMTNPWFEVSGEDLLYMQKAVFRKNEGGVTTPFVSDLFWGSKRLTVGATFTIGTDNFVCLNNHLYAKL